MIKAQAERGGTGVTISGDITDIMEDLTAIIKGVRNRLADDTDEELADMIIASCGQIAYTEDQDEIRAIMKSLEDYMEEKVSDLSEEVWW